MFSTPLTSCSIGAATVSATTLALAPGYVVVTETVGGDDLRILRDRQAIQGDAGRSGR